MTNRFRNSIVTVIFFEVVRAVLFSCGGTPIHPFVNPPAYCGSRSGRLGPDTEYSIATVSRTRAVYDDVLGVTSIANHLTYDAFGNVTSETDAAVDHIFGYTGRERDQEAGLNYHRARYYDPTVGEFIGEAPIGFEAGDANLYRYAGNSPVIYVDPSGLCGGADNGIYIPQLAEYGRWQTQANTADWAEQSRQAQVDSWIAALAKGAAAGRKIPTSNEPGFFSKLWGKVADTAIAIVSPYGDLPEYCGRLSETGAKVALQSQWNMDRQSAAMIASTSFPDGRAGDPWDYRQHQRLGTDGTQAAIDVLLMPYKMVETADATVQAGMTAYIGGGIVRGAATGIVRGVSRGGGPVAGGGAHVGNLSAGRRAQIQAFVDRRNSPVTVVGSQAGGSAGPISDFDYLIGGNSRLRQKARLALPKGSAGGEIGPRGETGIDIFNANNVPLDPAKPHIIFTPTRKPGG